MGVRSQIMHVNLGVLEINMVENHCYSRAVKSCLMGALVYLFKWALQANTCQLDGP